MGKLINSKAVYRVPGEKTNLVSFQKRLFPVLMPVIHHVYGLPDTVLGLEWAGASRAQQYVETAIL